MSCIETQTDKVKSPPPARPPPPEEPPAVAPLFMDYLQDQGREHSIPEGVCQITRL